MARLDLTAVEGTALWNLCAHMVRMGASDGHITDESVFDEPGTEPYGTMRFRVAGAESTGPVGGGDSLHQHKGRMPSPRQVMAEAMAVLDEAEVFLVALAGTGELDGAIVADIDAEPCRFRYTYLPTEGANRAPATLVVRVLPPEVRTLDSVVHSAVG